MRRFADMLPSGGRVLDIGSGPGWDADFLEGLGVRVHRTDVTAEFRDFQAERGQQVDALDVLTDEIIGDLRRHPHAMRAAALRTDGGGRRVAQAGQRAER